MWSEPKAPALGPGGGVSSSLFPMLSNMAEPIKKQPMCDGRGKGRDGPHERILEKLKK